jgi:hypothetical protein
VEIVQHVSEDDLERYAMRFLASAGIRTTGRAPAGLPVVPGSAGIHGSILGGDEGGGEDQAERNRRRRGAVNAVAVAGVLCSTGLVANELRASCGAWRGVWLMLPKSGSQIGNRGIRPALLFRVVLRFQNRNDL